MENGGTEGAPPGDGPSLKTFISSWYDTVGNNDYSLKYRTAPRRV
jgi:hypothetical protein